MNVMNIFCIETLLLKVFLIDTIVLFNIIIIHMLYYVSITFLSII